MSKGSETDFVFKNTNNHNPSAIEAGETVITELNSFPVPGAIVTC